MKDNVHPNEILYRDRKEILSNACGVSFNHILERKASLGQNLMFNYAHYVS